MEILLSILLFLIGAVIIWYSAEKFVQSAVAFSILAGISTFAIGVIFSGFEPENLSAGIAGALKGLSGVAMGTVIGSAIFLITIVLGATAFLYNFKISINKKYIWLTFVSVFPLLFSMLDGIISRADGIILLALFMPTMIYIYLSSKKEIFATSHEVKELLETNFPPFIERWKIRCGKIKVKPKKCKTVKSVNGAFVKIPPFYERRNFYKKHSKWLYIFLLVASLIGMTIGAEILGKSAKNIISYFSMSNTLFGMVFVAFAVSFEEFGRTLVPAKMKHPELAVGNVFGTVINLFLLNIGIIAIIKPVIVERIILALYFPFLIVSLMFAAIFISRGKLGKTEGFVLIGLYLVFLILNFWLT
ncbi:sodium:calcium antiporter [Candidatus Woesearchaeota archaeon]|nr:sodium:calcium antiporter [Candidatus Woesearchaeota archaeon]